MLKPGAELAWPLDAHRLCGEILRKDAFFKTNNKAYRFMSVVRLFIPLPAIVSRLLLKASRFARGWVGYKVCGMVKM